MGRWFATTYVFLLEMVTRINQSRFLWTTGLNLLNTVSAKLQPNIALLLSFIQNFVKKMDNFTSFAGMGNFINRLFSFMIDDLEDDISTLFDIVDALDIFFRKLALHVEALHTLRRSDSTEEERNAAMEHLRKATLRFDHW